jgi:hypothetical protein
MAEQALAGESFRPLRLGLVGDGLAEGRKLVCRKDDHKRFEQNHGFPETGIEVKMSRIDLFPDDFRVCGGAFGKMLDGIMEVLAQILNHISQSADLMKELEAMGEQDTI